MAKKCWTVHQLFTDIDGEPTPCHYMYDHSGFSDKPFEGTLEEVQQQKVKFTQHFCGDEHGDCEYYIVRVSKRIVD